MPIAFVIAKDFPLRSGGSRRSYLKNDGAFVLGFVSDPLHCKRFDTRGQAANAIRQRLPGRGAYVVKIEVQEHPT